MKINIYNKKKKPLMLLLLVLIACSVLFNCRGQKEVGKALEAKSTDTLNVLYMTNEMNVATEKSGGNEVDSSKILKNSSFNSDNIDFIDSLRSGLELWEGNNLSRVNLDSVPEILYKVLPQVIFVKSIQAGGRNYSRGFGYYNNKLYPIGVYYNILLDSMEYQTLPTFEDKVIALVYVLEDFNETLELTEIDTANETYGQLKNLFNYKITAQSNNLYEEYLLEYIDEQFVAILKISNNDVKGFKSKLLK